MKCDVFKRNATTQVRTQYTSIYITHKYRLQARCSLCSVILADLGPSPHAGAKRRHILSRILICWKETATLKTVGIWSSKLHCQNYFRDSVLIGDSTWHCLSFFAWLTRFRSRYHATVPNMFCIPVPGYVRGSSLIQSFLFAIGDSEYHYILRLPRPTPWPRPSTNLGQLLGSA
jgi:hypothetical protein